VQIYFSPNNSIVGTSINSYLLEKSRVVATAEKERNFHVFYALIASKIMPLNEPKDYKYLSRSKCYESSGINDKQYFDEIQEAMSSIGFSGKEQRKIWELLHSILELGNIEFDDSVHKEDESKPCALTSVSKKSI
jgi:myosin heavy subunit